MRDGDRVVALATGDREGAEAVTQVFPGGLEQVYDVQTDALD